VTTRLGLPLVGPGGEPVDLLRTLNSHGFADLAPTRLDEAAHTLEVTLRIPGARPRRVRVGPGRAGRAAIEVLGPGVPGVRARAAILGGVRHVLRMDQDLSGF
jgi:N-glycosylase/DNA lyase